MTRWVRFGLRGRAKFPRGTDWNFLLHPPRRHRSGAAEGTLRRLGRPIMDRRQLASFRAVGWPRPASDNPPQTPIGFVSQRGAWRTSGLRPFGISPRILEVAIGFVSRWVSRRRRVGHSYPSPRRLCGSCSRIGGWPGQQIVRASRENARHHSGNRSRLRFVTTTPPFDRHRRPGIGRGPYLQAVEPAGDMIAAPSPFRADFFRARPHGGAP